MVRKTQFSREDVVNAAFQVVKNEGIEQLSARKVAQELGSSTAPVYSNFENMEELETEVFAKAARLMLEYSTEAHTDNPFLNMGIGILKYAWECPLWYFAFSTLHEPGQPHIRGILDTLLKVMAEIPGLEDLHPLERKLLLRKMSIFTHGLASEICSGNITEEGMQDFIKILDEVGSALTADALTRPPRDEEELARMATLCHELTPQTDTRVLDNRKDDGDENSDH